jgi:thiosulfate/3-mercaptopyruvate sulfurtransferase
VTQTGPTAGPLPPLVSTTWLVEHLGDPLLRVLDASWYLPTSGRDARAEYRGGHVPGAVFFDLDAASDPATALPHMLPTEPAFAAYAGGLGIGPGTTVVAYDGSGNNISAGRAWWMFRAFGHSRVSVLDGGLGKWKAEGRPLEQGEVAPEPQRIEARLDRRQVRSMAEVESALADPSVQVVDVRAAGRFLGRDPEPRPIPSGHMPRSHNLPFGELFAADGTLLPPDPLRRLLARAGISPERPVIASCGSGTSAAALILALATLGSEGHAVYDGSWTEWASAGKPIARGEPAPA